MEEEKIDGVEEIKATEEFNLPSKVSIWSKIKNFLFKEVKVELTPKQQEFEDNMNEFLHQEVTWGKIHDFLFQEVSFKKSK